MFISCGDDKKAIVWLLNESNANFKRKWDLYTIIDMKEMKMDWFTFTYLNIIPIKGYLLLTTQNGYIFVYDIINKNIKFKNKIHFGSIEGLCSFYK